MHWQSETSGFIFAVLTFQREFIALMARIGVTFRKTHRNQSTAMINDMSSVGSPTDVNTITMVTRPA